MKRETQQALEWWNREDFNGSFEQQKLGLKYYPNGFDMDNEEQNIWEIWKKETQEYNETFNPEAHSSLIIDFDKHESLLTEAVKGNKVETIEEAAEKYQKQDMIGHNIQYRAYRAGAKSEASKNYWFQIFQEEQKEQFKQEKS